MTGRLHIDRILSAGHAADGEQVAVAVDTDIGEVHLIFQTYGLAEVILALQKIIDQIIAEYPETQPAASLDDAHLARRVEFMRGENGDQVLRVTLADGRSIPIRLTPDLAKALGEALGQT